MAGPGARGGALRSPEVGGSGVGGCWRLPWAGRRGSGLRPPPHTVPSAPPSPELGISFHKLLWGLLFPSSKVCAIFSHPSWAEGGGLTPPPPLGEGRGLQGR